MKRRFRYLRRLSRTSDEGVHAQSFGMRVGYWPCLRGPFVCIEFSIYRIDIWFGDPSYETTPESRSSSRSDGTCGDWGPYDTPCVWPSGHGPISKTMSHVRTHVDRYGRHWRTNP